MVVGTQSANSWRPALWLRNGWRDCRTDRTSRKADLGKASAIAKAMSDASSAKDAKTDFEQKETEQTEIDKDFLTANVRE